jgi:hypothetical protein
MSEPITTWHDAAAVLGISYDTLLRRRKRYGCTLELAHWRDADHVWSWYTALTAPKAEARKPGRPPKSKVARLTGPLDVAAKLRRFSGQ